MHEGLGSAELWRDAPQKIGAAAGCDIFVYSRYGNGRADVLREARTVSYMHDEADVLEQLLQGRGIDDAILIGHSDGASIALIHCGRYSGRVRAAVVLAPHLFVEEHSLRGIRRARDLYEQTDLREKLARYHTDPDATFYGWNRIWLDPAFARWNIREYTRRITVPVFAVQGAADEYGTFAQVTALAQDVPAPVDVLHLDDCGHNPLRDRPDCLAALARYVKRAAAASGP